MTGAAGGAAAGSGGGGGGIGLSVVLSPASSVAGYGQTGATANIQTEDVIATPSGGVAPYNYEWAQKGTSPYTWVISSAAAATTHFTANSVPDGVATNVQFEVTVTDAIGNKGKATVTAVVRNRTPFNPGGGGGGVFV